MKNKKSLIIYAIVSIVIITAIVVAILYFTTDVFKSNQQLFYKYLGQAKIIDMNLIEKCKIANNNLSQKSNSSNMKIKMINSKVNQETQISDIKEIFTMNSKGLKNTLLNQSYRDFVFSKDNQVFLTIKTLKDNTTYGVIADNILGRYLAVDNTNLKELFSKLKMTNTEMIPDSISVNYEELFSIDNETLEQLKETYLNLIYENINKENYYKIKNEDETEVLGISLTEQEVFEFLKIILDAVNNDSTFLNFIVSKFQMLNYNNINVEKVQTEIQKYIEVINNEEYSSEKDYLNIYIIIKEEKVCSINIETKYKEENNTDVENSLNNEYKKTLCLNLEEKDKILFKVTENNLDTFNVVLNYIYDDEKINLYMEIDFYGNEETNKLKLQYQMSDYKTDDIKKVMVIDIVSLNEKYQIEINNNILLKEDVQITKLTTENSVKINEMTPEDLEQIKNALLNRINELYSVDLRKTYNIIMKR